MDFTGYGKTFSASPILICMSDLVGPTIVAFGGKRVVGQLSRISILDPPDALSFGQTPDLAKHIIDAVELTTLELVEWLRAPVHLRGRRLSAVAFSMALAGCEAPGFHWSTTR